MGKARSRYLNPVLVCYPHSRLSVLSRGARHSQLDPSIGSRGFRTRELNPMGDLQCGLIDYLETIFAHYYLTQRQSDRSCVLGLKF